METLFEKSCVRPWLNEEITVYSISINEKEGPTGLSPVLHFFSVLLLKQQVKHKLSDNVMMVNFTANFYFEFATLFSKNSSES